MTEDDDQEKATRKTRGVPISLGLWWWSEIERAFGSRKNVVLCSAPTSPCSRGDPVPIRDRRDGHCSHFALGVWALL